MGLVYRHSLYISSCRLTAGFRKLRTCLWGFFFDVLPLIFCKEMIACSDLELQKYLRRLLAPIKLPVLKGALWLLNPWKLFHLLPRCVVQSAIDLSLVSPHICSGFGMERVNPMIRHGFIPARFTGIII